MVLKYVQIDDPPYAGSSGTDKMKARRWTGTIVGLALLLAVGCGDSGDDDGRGQLSPGRLSQPTVVSESLLITDADAVIAEGATAIPAPPPAADPSEQSVHSSKGEEDSPPTVSHGDSAAAGLASMSSAEVAIAESNYSTQVELTSPRDVSGLDLFSGRTGVVTHISDSTGESTVEAVLAAGLRLAGTSPVHIAFRGMASPSSIRCDWRGIARSPEQRERAIRFWLGIEPDAQVPSPSYVETLFTVTLNTLNPVFRETAKSNLLAIARGGLSTEYMFLTCYVDYIVSEYLLGAGPSTLTVAYDRMDEAYAYDLYRLEHADGSFGPATSTPMMSEGEYHAELDSEVWAAESSLAAMIGDRESIVFLAPMGAHNAIAVEAWQVVAQWDLQTDDQGTMNAVRYGAPQGDPEYTQTLANLKSRITAATTATTTPTRIQNVSGLTQYYRDIGAYGDITPDDGDTTPFTPAQPPPVPTCEGVSAVTGPRLNPGLVRDCSILLDSMDTLAGTAALDWTATSAISTWEGIDLNASSTRVTLLDLDDEDLDGTIPPALGGLSALVTLDLSDNDLTGEIPEELGDSMGFKPPRRCEI